MKLKYVLYFLSFLLFSVQTKSQTNTNPVVSNVTFTLSGTTVTVHYDVYDAEQTIVTVTMLVSSNNGITWDYDYFPAQGDIGPGIATGTFKTITWNYSGPSSISFQIAVLANDETPGGSSCLGTPTINYGGMTYNTVQIGWQCWLKENLNIGTRINGNLNQTSNGGNNFIEKYCYDDIEANCTHFGGLYQWDEAMKYSTTEGAQGICPTGWHMPTYFDYLLLGNIVNNNMKSLKAIGEGAPPGDGTNISGFTGLIAGHQWINGFAYLGGLSFIWGSSRLSNPNNRSYLLLDKLSEIFYAGFFDKPYGVSVRCIKDEFTCGISTVDYEGKTYHTVPIGTQCWLKENLDVGTRIESWLPQTNNNSKEKYCFGNVINNCNTYGGLYQWGEAMNYITTSGTQGICPSGWHIPTSAEFNTLATTVENDGNRLKREDQGSGAGQGTNTSGFSGLLGGYRHINGNSYDLGLNGDFWQSMELDGTNAWLLYLKSDNSNIYFSYDNKESGYSVRCIKDQSGCIPPNVPSPLGPSNGATNVNIPPTLSWTASLGATSYRLQVSTNNLFSDIVFDQSTIQFNSQSVSGLCNSTMYFWRVNASNSNCTSGWSPIWSFTISSTCPGVPTVYDPRDGGKTYNTVQIGTQCWLKENLDVGARINGNLPQTSNGGSNFIEKYCYNDDPNKCNTYGGLYQWNEAMNYVTTPGTQGICPAGWHIPTNGEFLTLQATVGNDGNALKAVGQGAGSGAGTNCSGFSALLSGARFYDGTFSSLQITGYDWSSTDNGGVAAYNMYLVSTDGGIHYYYLDKSYGYSVRCLKD